MMTYSQVREQMQDMLEPTEANAETGRGRFDLVDIFLATLIVANILATILETLPSLQVYEVYFELFELFSVIIFSVEYVLRLWICTLDPQYSHPIKGRFKFAMTPLALIDLVCILPFYLPMLGLDLRVLRLLRLVRLVRVLKLGRYSRSLQTIAIVIKDKKSDLSAALVVVVVLLIFASSFMYIAEHEAQPEEFQSIVHTMWWAVITLTTVGYGDVYPVTTVGKILSGVIALMGVGMVALPAGILASGFAEYNERRLREEQTALLFRKKKLAKKEGKMLYCPHCGEKLPHIEPETTD